MGLSPFLRASERTSRCYPGQRGGPVANKPKEQKMMCKRNQITAFPGKAFPGLGLGLEVVAQRRAGLRARRGVLLLVVLSLLMLFSLVAVTFVLVSSRHYDATRYAIKNEQTGDDPSQLLDNVFAQCIRGTNDPQSVIGPHGLLEDMYGNDGIVYRQHVLPPTLPTPLTVVAHSTTNLIYDLTFSPLEPIEFTSFPGIDVPTARTPPYPLIQAQLQTPGYFNGCVLTAIGGVADGRSTRILGWGYTPGPLGPPGQYRIRVMAFENISRVDLQNDPPLGFIVNGRPFNGTGFGLDPTIVDPTAPTLISAAQTIPLPSGPIDIPYALLPNAKYWDGQSADQTILPITPPTGYPIFGGIGGPDEDYDAPDTQNMLLAHLPLVMPAPNTPSGIIPSLHRPDTYLYLQQKYQTEFSGSAEGIEARRLVTRQSTLRPQSAGNVNDDHPRFPRIDLSAGPYDVDNDGDGIPESIWVDAGLPVRTAPDGRAYKPLVAILCLDLDGRLNVNAHGNIAHVDQYYHSMTAGVSPQAFSNSNLLASQFLGVATVGPELPRGQGYGPAEISLLPLFRSFPSSPPGPITASELVAYSKLLGARYSEPNVNLYDWGRDTAYQPVYNSQTGFVPAGTQRFGAYPGATAFGDRFAGLMRTTYPDPTDANRRSSFGTPPNLWGRGFVALDLAGNPMMPYMGVLADRDDSAYEMNLNRRDKRGTLVTTTPATPLTGEATPNPLDTPYMTVELERLLRVYDNDSSGLPDRLRQLVNAGGGPPLAVLRNMVTTDSFDLPVTSSLPTREILGGAANVMMSSNIIDLLTEKLTQGGFTGTIALEIPKMLPPEVIAGRKLDLNRPFGNGRDDDGDGVVDEPDENEPSFWFAAGMSVPVTFTAAPYAPNYVFAQDVDLNGTPDELTDRQMARQLFARHLYILMMLLKGNEEIDFDGNTGNNTAEETARGIAQWAVNIVDFRDRDSIMTPFHFNIYPFRDGWTANGDLTVAPPAGTAVVWGMERPELLITETLAYHDRRTEDTGDEATVDNFYGDTETMPGTTTEAMMDRQDKDFDQRLRPFAPFFIELYNPWLTQSSIDPITNGQPAAVEMPAELYTNPTYRGVKLDARDLQSNTSPVWRMLVVANASIGADPDDPGPPAPTVPFVDADVDRTVYFADPTSITDFGGAPRYFSDPAHPLAPVLPGRYAVVGSAGLPGLTNLGARQFVSPIARVQGAGDTANAANRRIILSPNPDPSVSQVQILNNNAPPPYAEPAVSEIQPAVAVALTEALMAGTPSTFPNVMASISEPKPNDPIYPPTTGTTAGGEQTYAPPLDIPLDTKNPYLGGATAPNQPPDGTRPNFRMIHLQRLANPLKPWDQNTNPYLTVDSMSIDCTVFNGVVDSSAPADPRAATSPPASGSPPPALYSNGLASYQRGDIFNVTNPPLWYSQPNNTIATPGLMPLVGGQQHYFNRALQHSLGYVNKAYGVPGDNTTTFVSTDPLIQPPNNRRSYLGLPKATATKAAPFVWLPWNNRPYANEMELLLVPQMRSWQLAVSYKPLPNAPYPVTTGRGHLPNLWETPASHWAIHGNLHRILDYVHVPSRFVGTEMELPPTNFAVADPYDAELRMSLLPPFNRISQYREPGKININTIPSDQFGAGSGSAIWDGVMNTTAAHNFPTWQEVSESRQGIATFLAGSYPTRFGNPFRSASGASYQLPGTDDQIDRDEIEVTFLRPLDPASANETEPLFRYLSTQSTDNPDANPYFRVNTLQRVKNLLTTRSNVYAVWITVGYFEVRPVQAAGGIMPPLARHPDGYQLWGELGSDTGEIKRHRAFYIYDRSIPVAFERGKDHNMADGILLKRFIE